MTKIAKIEFNPTLPGRTFRVVYDGCLQFTFNERDGRVEYEMTYVSGQRELFSMPYLDFKNWVEKALSKFHNQTIIVESDSGVEDFFKK